MRGMAGLEACESSGAGHLLSFKGTDTIPSIVMLENYYNADCEKELIGTKISFDNQKSEVNNINGKIYSILY